MKYVRQFRYSVFREMDFAFTHAKKPTGGIIRFACAAIDGLRAAFRALRDRDMPNHVATLTTQSGQFFASELTPKGLRENPLDRYRTNSEHIVAVYRWRGFDEPVVRHRGSTHMARMRRLALEQNIGYDWWGAIRSSWLGRKLFRRQKDHPGKNYCSENVVEMLVYCGYTGRMPKWDNPQAVMAWMASQPDQFERVEGWEAPLWSGAAARTGSSFTTA